MDKDCLDGSQIDDDQLYNIEFTVAIMVLSPVKRNKSKSPLRHFTINEWLKMQKYIDNYWS